MEKVILTEEGYKQLEKRLEELKFVKRPEITERIKIARDFGDLSENAEYDRSGYQRIENFKRISLRKRACRCQGGRNGYR